MEKLKVDNLESIHTRGEFYPPSSAPKLFHIRELDNHGAISNVVFLISTITHPLEYSMMHGER